MELVTVEISKLGTGRYCGVIFKEPCGEDANIFARRWNFLQSRCLLGLQLSVNHSEKEIFQNPNAWVLLLCMTKTSTRQHWEDLVEKELLRRKQKLVAEMDALAAGRRGERFSVAAAKRRLENSVKIDSASGCWNWMKSLPPLIKGKVRYGKIAFLGRKHLAHREQARAIRAELKGQHGELSRIARQYGVSVTAIWKIKEGKCYTH